MEAGYAAAAFHSVALGHLLVNLAEKIFFVLVALSAICEAVSVTCFKLSGNRGWLAVLGYILGFFVVAFYAEATKYTPIANSYPVYLVAIAVCITIAAVVLLREKVSLLWLLGFLLAVVGLVLLQLSMPSES